MAAAAVMKPLDVWSLANAGGVRLSASRPRSAAGACSSTAHPAPRRAQRALPASYMLYLADDALNSKSRGASGAAAQPRKLDPAASCPLVLGKGTRAHAHGRPATRLGARTMLLNDVGNLEYQSPKKFPKSDTTSAPKIPSGVLTARSLGAPPVLDPRQPMSFWFSSGVSGVTAPKASQPQRSRSSSVVSRDHGKQARPASSPAAGRPAERMASPRRRSDSKASPTTGALPKGSPRPSPKAAEASALRRAVSKPLTEGQHPSAVLGRFRRSASKEQALHEHWAQGVLGDLSTSKAENAAKQPSSQMDVVQLALHSRGMTEPLQKFVQRRHCIPGAPTMGEVLERTHTTWEGWTQAERWRVQRAHRRYWQVFETEVDKRDLLKILGYLGYLAYDEDVIAEIANSVTDLNMLNLEELVKVLEIFAAREEAEILDVTCQYFGGCSQDELSVEKHELPQLLREFEVFPPRSIVEQLLLVSGLKDEPAKLGKDELLQFLAAYREAEGLSSAEVDLAKEVFENFAPEVVDMGQKNVEREMPLKSLEEALIIRYTHRARDDIQAVLPTDLEKRSTQGICFQEFCYWVRTVRDKMLSNLWQEFDSMELDEDEHAPLEHARAVLHTLGYTLSQEAFNEFLGEVVSNLEDNLSFDSFVQVVRRVQEHEGFMRRERHQLSEMFERFDQAHQGELSRRECLDLLRYVHGMSLRVDIVNRIIDEADCNSSDTMDFGEFLFVMRGYRQIELAQDRQAYNDNGGFDGVLRVMGLQGALAQVGQHLEDEVRQNLSDILGLRSDALPETHVSFDDFVSIVDQCRHIRVGILRKQASFSDMEFIYMRHQFEECLREKKDHPSFMELGDMLFFLMDLGCRLDTTAERARVLEMLEQARACTIDAGVSEEEAGGRHRITLILMVHLLRVVIRHKEVEREAREMRAAEKAGFSAVEVAEFRKVFTRWILVTTLGEDEGSLAASPRDSFGSAPPNNSTSTRYSKRSRRTVDRESLISNMTIATAGAATSGAGRRSMLSALEVQDDMRRQMLVEQNPADTIRHALRGLGDTVPLKALLEFLRSTRLREQSRKSDWNGLLAMAEKLTDEDCDGDGLDFANFLALMRWALDHDLGRSPGETTKQLQRRLSRILDEDSLRRPPADHQEATRRLSRILGQQTAGAEPQAQQRMSRGIDGQDRATRRRASRSDRRAVTTPNPGVL